MQLLNTGETPCNAWLTKRREVVMRTQTVSIAIMFCLLFTGCWKQNESAQPCSLVEIGSDGNPVLDCGGQTIVMKNGKDGKDGLNGTCTTPDTPSNGNPETIRSLALDATSIKMFNEWVIGKSNLAACEADAVAENKACTESDSICESKYMMHQNICISVFAELINNPAYSECLSLVFYLGTEVTEQGDEVYYTVDVLEDADSDGLTNVEEFEYWFNPCKASTYGENDYDLYLKLKKSQYE